MPTIPTPIDALPTPVPSSTDPTNFDARADALITALPDAVDQINAVAVNAYNNAAEAAASAVAAVDAATQAFLTANAAMHDPAANYAEGQNAISSINYQTYRRKAPGGTDAVDPAASTLWELLGSTQSSAASYNMVRNGGFTVMGGGQVLTTIAANAHINEKALGWRAGASGLTWSAAAVSGERVVTITAGSLVQNIWADQIRAGTLYLTWDGTAQGRINGGAYGSSGVSAVYVGANVSVEFSGGTVSHVQLSEGAPSIFLRRSLAEEEEMFQPYYWSSVGGVVSSSGWNPANMPGATIARRVSAETATNFEIRFPRKMAIAPTMMWLSPVTGSPGFIRNVTTNADVAVTGAGTSSPTQFAAGGVSHASNGAAGNVIAAHWVADARI